MHGIHIQRHVNRQKLQHLVLSMGTKNRIKQIRHSYNFCISLTAHVSEVDPSLMAMFSGTRSGQTKCFHLKPLHGSHAGLRDIRSKMDSYNRGNLYQSMIDFREYRLRRRRLKWSRLQFTLRVSDFGAGSRTRPLCTHIQTPESHMILVRRLEKGQPHRIITASL